MTALDAVAHGTAEQLARIHHFRQLDLPEAHELDDVMRFLIGQVTDWRQVVEHLGDDLDQLWSLLTQDFDDAQLDELTETDWERHSFSSYQQEVEHRHTMTVTRLVDSVEGEVHLARLVRAENIRPGASGVAA